MPPIRHLMILDAWKAFIRWFLPDFGMTDEQIKSRNRATIPVFAGVALLLGPILLAAFTNNGVFMLAVPFALLWGLPIVVAMHLGDSRGRTGWLWGFCSVGSAS